MRHHGEPPGFAMVVCGAGAVLLAALATGAERAHASRAFALVEQRNIESNPTNLGDLVLSPGGLHLYGVAPAAPGLVALERDPVTGAVAVIQSSVAPAGVSELRTPALSPDGTHLYVTARAFPTHPGGLILTYDVAVDGTVSLLQSLEPTTATLPSAPIVSPDGLHLYASSSGGIALFHRDPVTGLLTDGVVDHPGTRGPLAVSPDGATVYGVSAGAGLQAFSRDPATGLLTLVDTEDAGGLWPNFPTTPVVFSPDGLFLYALAEHTLFILSRDPDTSQMDLVATEVDGVGGIDGLRYVTQVRVSADGLFLYAASGYINCCLFGGDNALSTFSRDVVSGEITFVDKTVSSRIPPQGFSPELLVTDDGAHAYVTDHQADGITVFSLDAVSGLPTKEAGLWEFKHATSLAEAAGGSQLYAAAAEVDGIIGLSRDAATGRLAQITQAVDGLGGVVGLAGVHDVALSSDERHLYAVSPTQHSIVALARDPGTGALSWVETEWNGVGGVSGLGGARAVDVSADGRSVYVAAHDDDAVVTFSRDVVTGELSFVDVAFDGVSGVDGLDGANSVVTSPDGLHVYVAGAIDDAVAAFVRDGVTGALLFLQVLRDGVLGVDGIDGASSILTSADGRFLYVYGVDEPGIGVFSRHLASGLLTPSDAEIDGVLGAAVPRGDSLQNTRGIVFGPNEEHLVVVSDPEPVFGLFRRDQGTGNLAFVQIGDGSLPPVPRGAKTAWVSPAADEILLVGSPLDGFGIVLEPDRTCPVLPLVSCRTASLGKLTVRTHPIGARKKLLWSWLNGDATSVAEFDPGTDPYMLCGYDASLPTPELTLESYVPANVDCTKNDNEKPCWKSGAVVAVYKHGLATPDGVGSMKLVSGETGKAKIKLKAKGTNTLLPPLPLPLPYRLQLIGPTGRCWEGTYSTAKKNDAVQFKGAADSS